MGFFSSITNFVADAFSGDSAVSSLVSSVAEAGVSAYTANQTAKANTKAANTVARGYEAQANAIREGNAQAQKRFETMQDQSETGIQYLQRVANQDPYTLTPEQEEQLELIRANGINSLNQSGMRGSGRAVTQSLRKIESDFTSNAIDSNISRSQSAASQLAGYNQSANNSAAQADLSTGRAVGSLGAEGDVAKAGADLANSQLSGETMGEAISGIQSLIKNEEKEGRKSKYGWGGIGEEE